MQDLQTSEPFIVRHFLLVLAPIYCLFIAGLIQIYRDARRKFRDNHYCAVCDVAGSFTKTETHTETQGDFWKVFLGMGTTSTTRSITRCGNGIHILHDSGAQRVVVRGPAL